MKIIAWFLKRKPRPVIPDIRDWGDDWLKPHYSERRWYHNCYLNESV
jgi:hypothetical protein